MREIKFRAFYKPTKTMNKVGQVTLEKGIWNYEPDNKEYIGVCVPYQPSFELMQYTGLHDKNGKEIYEGDIAEIRVGRRKIIALIEYSEKYAQFVIRCNEVSDDCEPIGDIGNKNLEVIGNVWENKDLLEEV